METVGENEIPAIRWTIPSQKVERIRLLSWVVTRPRRLAK
jgi:hypothetical protein